MMPKKRILVVEDDAALARVLKDSLTFAGFAVDCVGDGDTALQRIRADHPDLILLDIMLPRQNGFELCRVIRQSGRHPVIMLTAREQKADKVRGLNAGADDYVTKPFHPEELLARINAVLRRVTPTVDRITLGQLVVDFASLSASLGAHTLHLTHREFEVLRYLAERRGRVVTRSELLREIWGYLDTPNTRSVDDAIARLRKKIEEDPHTPRLIRTAYGGGYCLSGPDDPPEMNG